MLTDNCCKCETAEVPLGQAFCVACLLEVCESNRVNKCWNCACDLTGVLHVSDFCPTCGQPVRNSAPVLINSLPETRIYSRDELREAALRMVDAVADA